MLTSPSPSPSPSSIPISSHLSPPAQTYAASAVLELMRRALTRDPPADPADADAADPAAADPAAAERAPELPPPLHAGLQLRHPLACYVWGLDYRHDWHQARPAARAHAPARTDRRSANPHRTDSLATGCSRRRRRFARTGGPPRSSAAPRAPVASMASLASQQSPLA